MRQARQGRRNRIYNPPRAVAEVSYRSGDAAREECEMFVAALPGVGKKPADAFMTAASPGIIATTMENAYYDSYENYVFALARELRKEYEIIASYGFMLQLDAPDFGLERARMFKHRTDGEFLATMELNIEAINRATQGIPRHAIRLHVCWGNWEGPHTHDFPLAELLPLLYRAKVGALSIEFANPRHQHEYRAITSKSVARRDDPNPGRDRHDHELRRTPRSCCQPDLRSRRCRGRPIAGDRGHRLWFCHVGGSRGRCAGRYLGEAEVLQRGCRHREQPSLEPTSRILRKSLATTKYEVPP